MQMNFKDMKNKVVEKYRNNWKAKLRKPKQLLFALILTGMAFPNDASLGKLQSHLKSIENYIEQSGEKIVCDRLCTCKPVVKYVSYEKRVYVPGDSQKEKKVTLEDVVSERYNKMTDTEFERKNHENSINRINQYDKIFETYANRYGVDKNLMKAIAFVESKGRHKGLVTKKWKNKVYTKKIPGQITTSHVGAKGMMQLMPATAKELKVNPKYLRSNIMGATKLMRKNLKYFEGNMVPAITAYNAGCKGTMKLIKKAQSFDLLDYRKFSESSEIKDYTINVLVAKTLFDNFEMYTEEIVSNFNLIH